jgi:hypothetical protein
MSDNIDEIIEENNKMLTEDRPEFLKRNFIISDLGFIARSFANGMRQVNPYMHMIDDVFYQYFRPLIQKMICDEDIKINIYYFIFENEETLAGYTITHGKHLIYCYIKRPYRGFGLFSKMKKDYEHCNFRIIANGLTKKLFPNLCYDPIFAISKWSKH